MISERAKPLPNIGNDAPGTDVLMNSPGRVKTREKAHEPLEAAHEWVAVLLWRFPYS